MKPAIEVHDYEGLQLALRERAEELNVSRLTLDEATGLPSGYSGKLLCMPPVKSLGPISLGLMLQALGLKLFVAEDYDALAKISRRLVPKKRSTQPPSIGGGDRLLEAKISNHMADLGRRGACARNKSMTVEQRREAARLAVTARWAKRRSA